MGIKVVATKKGFYKQIREIGELFELASKKDFSERWMKTFESKKAADDESPPGDNDKDEDVDKGVQTSGKREPVVPGEATTLKELQDKQAAAGQTENWAE